MEQITLMERVRTQDGTSNALGFILAYSFNFLAEDTHGGQPHTYIYIAIHLMGTAARSTTHSLR